MTPPTHFLLSWLLANTRSWNRGDMAAVVIAGLSPDLDGLGYPVQWFTSGTDHELAWYTAYHHVVGHGLVAGLICTIAVYAWRRSVPVAILALVAFHLHLLCDLAGSGGPEGEPWPIVYLWPFSLHETAVSWQWPLNSPINFAITLASEVVMLGLAMKRGFSPLALFSPRADRYVFDLAGRATAHPRP